MKVRWGSNRIVFIFCGYAVKFARLRFLKSMAWIILSLLNSQWKKRFFKRYGKSYYVAMRTYLFTGRDSNFEELEYFHSHPNDERVMPTVSSFLYGWIITQEEGEPVTREELFRNHPFHSFTEACIFNEFFKVVQFCKRRKSGKIVLVDYGSRETCMLLNQTLRA